MCAYSYCYGYKTMSPQKACVFQAWSQLAMLVQTDGIRGCSFNLIYWGVYGRMGYLEVGPCCRKLFSGHVILFCFVVIVS